MLKATTTTYFSPLRKIITCPPSRQQQPLPPCCPNPNRSNLHIHFPTSLIAGPARRSAALQVCNSPLGGDIGIVSNVLFCILLDFFLVMVGFSLCFCRNLLCYYSVFLRFLQFYSMHPLFCMQMCSYARILLRNCKILSPIGTSFEIF